MTIRQLGFVVGAVIFLCAAESTLAAPKSEALQIAHAAGLKKLQDVRQVDLENALKETPDMTVSNVITTVGVGTEVFSQQTGWSLGGETAALGALTLLSALPVHRPERHTRFLVWMPETLAADRKAAARLFRETVVDAFKTALPNYDIALAEREDKGRLTYLAVSDESCTTCAVYSKPIFHDLVRPKVRKAPESIGGYESYRWSVGGIGNADFNGFPMTAAHLTPEERLNVLTRVSEQLPKWVYLYVAPSEALAGFPTLLHQGKPMLFVEPLE